MTETERQRWLAFYQSIFERVPIMTMTRKSPQKPAPKSNKTSRPQSLKPDAKIRPGKQPGASA